MPRPWCGSRSRLSQRAATWSLIAVVAISCRSREPLVVAVEFRTSWIAGSHTLTTAERAFVTTTAIQTLRGAFDGFGVRFVEGAAATRVIRVEDTPFAADSRFLVSFGAVGVTFPASMVSSVRFDVLCNAELAAVHCQDFTGCSKAPSALLEGLGRGIGATAAHELGHQAIIRFTRDVPCRECYDGTSTSYEHFFGAKHWSPAAMEIMRRVLPAVRR